MENGLKADLADDLMVTMEIEKQMDASFEAILPTINQLAQQLALTVEEKKELLDIYKKYLTIFMNIFSRMSNINNLL